MTDIRPGIEGPLDWRGVQMRKCTDWLVEFDASERAELERATAGVRHKPIAEIVRADFPLAHARSKACSRQTGNHRGARFCCSSWD